MPIPVFLILFGAGLLGIGVFLIGLLTVKSEAGLFALGILGTLLCAVQCLLLHGMDEVGAATGGSRGGSGIGICYLLCIFSVVAYWVLASYKSGGKEPDEKD